MVLALLSSSWQSSRALETLQELAARLRVLGAKPVAASTVKNLLRTGVTGPHLDYEITPVQPRRQLQNPLTIN